MAITMPKGVPMLRWLPSVPSAFLLTAEPEDVLAVHAVLSARGIGSVAGRRQTVWDLAQAPLIGCGAP
jgi:selenophosphate synthetase-related protein